MRRGRLSVEEQKFVATNLGKMTVEQMAAALDRRVGAVQSYLTKYSASLEKTAIDATVAYDLEERSFWPTLKKQFTSEELKIFKADWSRTVHQFGADLTHTEEKQVIQACTLSIMMYRTMEEMHQNKSRLHSLEDLYQRTLDDDPKNSALLTSIDNQIASVRVAANSLTHQYDKLFKDFQSIQKDMKATRDQRINKLADSKTTFFDWLNQMEDEQYRKQESEEMEIRRVAMWKEHLLKGAQLHKYADGNLDLPILNAETIELVPVEQLGKENHKDDSISDQTT